MSFTELFEVVYDLAVADANIAHILRNHFAIVELLLRAPETAVRDRLLRAAGEERKTISRLTDNLSASAGNRAVPPRLADDGEAYRLTERYVYATGCRYTDLIVARISLPDGRVVNGIIGTGGDGVEIKDDWDGFGQRLTASGTVEFHDVVVGREDVVEEFTGEESGLPENRRPYLATFPQLYLTTLVAAITRTIVHDVVADLHRRSRNYYHGLAERPENDPNVQTTLGEISSISFVLEAAVFRAIAELGTAIAGNDDEASWIATLDASRTKVVADELALRAASILFDAGSATTTARSRDLDRHWRNIRVLASHNPRTFKQRLVGEYEATGHRFPTGRAYF